MRVGLNKDSDVNRNMGLLGESVFNSGEEGGDKLRSQLLFLFVAAVTGLTGAGLLLGSNMGVESIQFGPFVVSGIFQREFVLAQDYYLGAQLLLISLAALVGYLFGRNRRPPRR